MSALSPTALAAANAALSLTRAALLVAGATIIVSGGATLYFVNKEFSALREAMYEEDAEWERRQASWDADVAERTDSQIAYNTSMSRTDKHVDRLRNLMNKN